MHHPAPFGPAAANSAESIFARVTCGIRIARVLLLVVLALWGGVSAQLAEAQITYGTGQQYPGPIGGTIVIPSWPAGYSAFYDGLVYTSATRFEAPADVWLEVRGSAPFTLTSGSSFGIFVSGRISLVTDQTWVNNGTGIFQVGEPGDIHLNNYKLTIDGTGDSVLTAFIDSVNTAGIEKNGSGTLTIPGILYKGVPVTLNSGALRLIGSTFEGFDIGVMFTTTGYNNLAVTSDLVINGGRFDLGYGSVTPGTMTVSTLTLASGGTITMPWGSKIVASGAATLSGGTFSLSLSRAPRLQVRRTPCSRVVPEVS